MKSNTNKEQIGKYLDEKKAEGLIRIGIVSFLNYTKIGQNVLLQEVFKNKAESALIDVLQKEGKKEDHLKSLSEDQVKQKGFYSPVSLANFAFQLPAEQRQILVTLLKDQKAKSLLQGAIDNLLTNYVYSS